jgi:hypothetical protein
MAHITTDEAQSPQPPCCPNCGHVIGLRLIRCYDEKVEGYALRKEQLGLSNANLESICNMAAGVVDKLLGPSRSKGVGATADDEFMKGLAVDFIMVASPEKLKMIEAEYESRVATNVRAPRRVAKSAVRRVMKELARKSVLAMLASGKQARASKGGNARAKKLSKEQRSAIARAAANVMHARRRALMEAA